METDIRALRVRIEGLGVEVQQAYDDWQIDPESKHLENDYFILAEMYDNLRDRLHELLDEREEKKLLAKRQKALKSNPQWGLF